MTALVAHAPALRLNWPRIGALSGTMSLHIGIIMLLLTPPVALEVMRRMEPDTFVVTIVDPKPPEIVKPEPPMPKPPQAVREAPKPPRVEVKREVAPVDTTERTPMSTDGPPASGPPGPSTAGPVADTAPTALAYNLRTRVPYPIDSVRRGEHGKVLLRVLVNSDGTVQTVEIEHSSGYARLDAAAREAVRHWTFQAGTRGGVAQSAWALVPIAFDLTQL